MKTKYLLSLIVCLGFCLMTNAGASLYAQGFTKQDLSFTGKNFYGFALNTNPYRQSNGYFTYDMEVGFQTMPSDSCVYVRSYGYPLLSVGISTSSLSDFAMDGDSFLPDIYSFVFILVPGNVLARKQ